MRRIILTIAAVALALAGLTAAASTATAAAARCSARYDWHTGTHYPALERYVVADWETQCSPRISMQLRIQCENVVTHQFYSEKSGIVTALEKDDETHCGFDDAGLTAAIRFNGGTWRTLCAPCNFQPIKGRTQR